MLSLAIPHYNNSVYISEILINVIYDDRIDEIVICDDNSQDYEKLRENANSFKSNKIKLYKNVNNLGCYHNKIETLRKCSNKWAILLDSDNIIDKHYLDVLFDLKEWNDDTIYAPIWAYTFPGEHSKLMNYSFLKGVTIDKKYAVNNMHILPFKIFLNTGNYILPVKKYLNCMDQFHYDRKIIEATDVAVANGNWLYYDNKIKVVDNLIYKHRLHSKSTWTTSNAKQYTNDLFLQIKEKLS